MIKHQHTREKLNLPIGINFINKKKNLTKK